MWFQKYLEYTKGKRRIKKPPDNVECRPEFNTKVQDARFAAQKRRIEMLNAYGLPTQLPNPQSEQKDLRDIARESGIAYPFRQTPRSKRSMFSENESMARGSETASLYTFHPQSRSTSVVPGSETATTNTFHYTSRPRSTFSRERVNSPPSIFDADPSHSISKLSSAPRPFSKIWPTDGSRTIRDYDKDYWKEFDTNTTIPDFSSLSYQTKRTHAQSGYFENYNTIDEDRTRLNELIRIYTKKYEAEHQNCKTESTDYRGSKSTDKRKRINSIRNEHLTDRRRSTRSLNERKSSGTKSGNVSPPLMEHRIRLGSALPPESAKETLDLLRSQTSMVHRIRLGSALPLESAKETMDLLRSHKPISDKRQIFREVSRELKNKFTDCNTNATGVHFQYSYNPSVHKKHSDNEKNRIIHPNGSIARAEKEHLKTEKKNALQQYRTGRGFEQSIELETKKRHFSPVENKFSSSLRTTEGSWSNYKDKEKYTCTSSGELVTYIPQVNALDSWSDFVNRERGDKSFRNEYRLVHP